jgi:sulfur carrier protein
MQIFVNGQPYESNADNLAALLVECEYDAVAVATALNETFVRAKERLGRTLAEGDRVEILTPRQGG